jgi:hypothetical protein
MVGGLVMSVIAATAGDTAYVVDASAASVIAAGPALRCIRFLREHKGVG